VFLLDDTKNAPPVILINEALARRYFGDRDPSASVTNRGQIVGVVGDVMQVALDQAGGAGDLLSHGAELVAGRRARRHAGRADERRAGRRHRGGACARTRSESADSRSSTRERWKKSWRILSGRWTCIDG
jgi:hypothetical protein